jgi:hypothetical protein
LQRRRIKNNIVKLKNPKADATTLNLTLVAFPEVFFFCPHSVFSGKDSGEQIAKPAATVIAVSV